MEHNNITGTYIALLDANHIILIFALSIARKSREFIEIKRRDRILTLLILGTTDRSM
jgi:hypothetical protein